MEYRKIRADEMAAAGRIMAQAFHAQNFQESLNESGHDHEYFYGAVQEDGHMAATLCAPPHSVNYFGQYVPMAAVGGVASLPESRRGGHMRKLITFMLQDAKQRGDKLAGLYPFSHIFYRKFGFEQCCRAQNLVIPMEKLTAFPSIGEAKQCFAPMDEQIFSRIWKAYTKNMNLACDREGKWDRYLNKDPYRERVYTYLWYDESGSPEGYVIYASIRHKDAPAYGIRDMAYTSPKALRGLMGFLKALAPQGFHLCWLAPQNFDTFMFFAEPYEIERVLNCHGMARLVDIPWCMENRPWPEKGTLTFRVTGDVLEENNGVYRVTIQDTVKCEKLADGDCDMTLSVQCLSALALGAETVDSCLMFREDILIHRNEELIRRCFPHCSVQLTEAF